MTRGVCGIETHIFVSAELARAFVSAHMFVHVCVRTCMGTVCGNTMCGY